MSENRRFYRLTGEWTVVCHPLGDAGVPGPSIGGRTRNISADRTQRADLSRFVFAQARLRQAGAGTTDESAA